jgi:hypothetical protein
MYSPRLLIRLVAWVKTEGNGQDQLCPVARKTSKEAFHTVFGGQIVEGRKNEYFPQILLQSVKIPHNRAKVKDSRNRSVGQL